ncbi:hypothetical protein KSZ_03250 [Dictyobacter formicarum]|uniref:Uncharacterized protein n=1 Tax=Dictyobacter formicarum TaxID=2778368 RepID=A0ABQ3V8M6_9CHLR|nr:hypothetical protein KSZ_03250 [Dictyobacter formicarum]
MPRLGAGRHVLLLDTYTRSLQCLQMWCWCERCKGRLLSQYTRGLLWIYLLGDGKQLQMEIKATQKSLEPTKDAQLFVFREQTDVFPFYLQRRPVANRFPFLLLVYLATSAMVECVYGDPVLLDGWKAFAPRLSFGLVALSRLPDGVRGDGFCTHNQEEPVDECETFDFRMDEDHGNQSDQESDDEAWKQRQ